jgi:hypothetical protein
VTRANSRGETNRWPGIKFAPTSGLSNDLATAVTPTRGILQSSSGNWEMANE